MKLTEKQKRFADYYIETGNARESAIRAGYSKKTAGETGYENINKPHIRTYIDDKLDKIADKRIMKAHEALELLTSVARGEITETSVTPSGDVIEKPADVKDRIKATESILKRYPMNKQEELRDKKLEAEIAFIHERIKLLQGEVKDTSLLNELIKVVNEDG